MSSAPVDSSHKASKPSEFDWNTSPLPEVQSRLADLKAIYERALTIVVQRQSKLPIQWKCWTQAHKRQVPKSVVALCRGDIVDGRWLFKNDGDRDAQGNPIVVCSQLCFTVYSQDLQARKLRAKLAVAGEEGGNLPAESK